MRFFASDYTCSIVNYYPFGLQMPGRSYESEGYRFGFNGKEKDQDFQNNYDYGFRIYNPSIAKFLSVDPLTKSYPMLTPYQFASNTPIQAVDLDGLEAYHFHSLGMYTKFTSMIEGKSESEVKAIASNMYYGVNDWINKQDKLHSMEKGWGADSEYNIAVTRNDGGPFRVFAPGDNVASIHYATDKLEEIRQGELQKRQAAYEKAVFKMYKGIEDDMQEREKAVKAINITAGFGGSLLSLGFGSTATLVGTISVGWDITNIGLTLDYAFDNPLEQYASDQFGENVVRTTKNLYYSGSLLLKGYKINSASNPDLLQRFGNAGLDMNSIIQNNSNNEETNNLDEN